MERRAYLFAIINNWGEQHHLPRHTCLTLVYAIFLFPHSLFVQNQFLKTIDIRLTHFYFSFFKTFSICVGYTAHTHTHTHTPSPLQRSFGKAQIRPGEACLLCAWAIGAKQHVQQACWCSSQGCEGAEMCMVEFIPRSISAQALKLWWMLFCIFCCADRGTLSHLCRLSSAMCACSIRSAVSAAMLNLMT